MLRLTVMWGFALLNMLVPHFTFADEPKIDPTLNIARDLQDADESVRQSAAAAIVRRMNDNPAACAEPLALRWWKPLHLAGYDKEVADWSLTCLISTTALPKQAVTEFLLEARVRTLLAIGRKPEALSAARSLFNVIRRNRAHLATQLIVKCNESDQKPSTSPTSTNDSDSVAATIKAITIDDTDFRSWIDKEQSDTFVSHLRRGYRLLVAGKPAEARQDFEKCLSKSKSDEETATLNDFIARTFRAEDGNFTREDQYIKSHAVVGTPTSGK
jgi:hypothetical protein